VGVRVHVAAAVEGRSVDLYMLDRAETRIVEHSFDIRGLYRTWRDGEKPHLSAESGDLADTGMHPDLVAGIRQAWGNARLWAAGAYLRWEDAPDVFPTGPRIYYADELGKFPASKPRRRSIVVDLVAGEYVEVSHYLVRPGLEADAFLAEQRAAQDVEIEVVDDWTPLSVVRTWRFDDRGFIQGIGSGGDPEWNRQRSIHS
jgi:hypothetical protein